MTYHGRVIDGLIVLEPPVKLPDGVVVRVEVEAPDDQVASLRDGLSKLSGTAPGLPRDMAQQHDHYIHGTPRK